MKRERLEFFQKILTRVFALSSFNFIEHRVAFDGTQSILFFIDNYLLFQETKNWMFIVPLKKLLNCSFPLIKTSSLIFHTKFVQLSIKKIFEVYNKKQFCLNNTQKFSLQLHLELRNFLYLKIVGGNILTAKWTRYLIYHQWQTAFRHLFR